MNIRPIRNTDSNKRKTKNPDYYHMQELNLFRVLNPQYNNEGDINERISVGPDYDFNLFENNNNNYSDFIRDFNSIHPPIYDNSNSLLHPPNYNNNSLLFAPNDSILLNPPNQENIQEYYQNHRDSDLFYNQVRSDNLIHRTYNHNNSLYNPTTGENRYSFSISHPSLRHDFIQHPNSPENTL
jgi:hypothetical protein